MAEALHLHPAELAYIFSYMKVGAVIGHGAEPFAPPDGKPDPWYGKGRDRLLAARHLVPGKQKGRYRFSDRLLRIAVTLSEPQIVLLTQRKEGAGVRTLTHHVSGTSVVELQRLASGDFAVVEHGSLAPAAGAAAAFAGASREPVTDPARLEANQKVFEKIQGLAREGKTPAVLAALAKLGASEAEAKSACLALAQPAAAGVVSVMYCAANAVMDIETYAVLTNAAGHTWVVFPPAGADGPVVLEKSSIGGLAARILVTVAARMVLPV